MFCFQIEWSKVIIKYPSFLRGRLKPCALGETGGNHAGGKGFATAIAQENLVIPAVNWRHHEFISCEIPAKSDRLSGME